MMLKKPVTPFTRYSTPASRAVFLVEFIPLPPPPFAHDSRLNYGPLLQLLYYVTSGPIQLRVVILAISIFRKFEFSRVFSSPKSHEATCHWHEPEANTGSPYDGQSGS